MPEENIFPPLMTEGLAPPLPEVLSSLAVPQKTNPVLPMEAVMTFPDAVTKQDNVKACQDLLITSLLVPKSVSRFSRETESIEDIQRIDTRKYMEGGSVPILKSSSPASASPAAADICLHAFQLSSAGSRAHVGTLQQVFRPLALHWFCVLGLSWSEQLWDPLTLQHADSHCDCHSLLPVTL